MGFAICRCNDGLFLYGKCGVVYWYVVINRLQLGLPPRVIGLIVNLTFGNRMWHSVWLRSRNAQILTYGICWDWGKTKLIKPYIIYNFTYTFPAIYYVIIEFCLFRQCYEGITQIFSLTNRWLRPYCKNIKIHTAHTIVSWPSPKQWAIVISKLTKKNGKLLITEKHLNHPIGMVIQHDYKVAYVSTIKSVTTIRPPLITKWTKRVCV